jgi:hypothetical protein
MSTTSTPSENERLRTHNEFLKTALRAQRIFTAPGGYDQSEVLAVLGMTNESFASFAARERLNAPSALREMVERVVVQALSQDAPITPAVQPVSAGTRPTGRAGARSENGQGAPAALDRRPLLGEARAGRRQGDDDPVPPLPARRAPAAVPPRGRQVGPAALQPRARGDGQAPLRRPQVAARADERAGGRGAPPVYHA